MARVKGPNGLVLTFADDVAEGLLKSPEFVRVEDEKPKDKPTAAKRSASKK